MADRYALYCSLSESNGRLVSELRELVARHIGGERPWRLPRGERPDPAGADGATPKLGQTSP